MTLHRRNRNDLGETVVKWPLETSPIPDSELPLYNSYYLHACRTPEDPAMIWGTEVEVSKLQDYLRIANRESSFLLTTSHILIRAVAKALEKHPDFNQRVVGKRIYRFKAIHILMAMQDPREQQAELLLVKDANQRSLSDIAQTIWKHHQDAARGNFTYQKEKQTFRFFPQPIGRWILNFQQFLSNRFHLPETSMCERQRCSPVLVNYLVESNKRKGIFLREIIRLFNISAIVHDCRVENYDGPFGITADCPKRTRRNTTCSTSFCSCGPPYS